MPTPAEFIASCLEAAQKVKETYRVPIAVTIAQAALESGWGNHVKGNAYFGVKGVKVNKDDPGAKGIDFSTTEVIDGKVVHITDTFRAYESLEEAAMGYGVFLATQPRYKDCFQWTNDPEKFAACLAGKGYATAPDYAAKIVAIIRQYGLAKYDV